jgi:hypothetical protein
MGTSVTLGAALGTAVVGVVVVGLVVAAGAEDTTGLVTAGWVVAALADDVAALDAAPAADDVLGLQADSASPMPRPSAEMPAVLAVCMKCRKFIVVIFPHCPDCPDRPSATINDEWWCLVKFLNPARRGVIAASCTQARRPLRTRRGSRRK